MGSSIRRLAFRPAVILVLAIALSALSACSPKEPDQPGRGEGDAFDEHAAPTADTAGQPKSAAEESRAAMQPAEQSGADGPRQARADLYPTEGNDVRGSVIFTRTGEQMRVVATVRNLSPGPHGFHIHETGDCSAPDATSAGGHFAPDGHPHGGPDSPPDERHAGDLGNLEADEDGVATYVVLDDRLTFEGRYGILGRAVIVHAGEDDLTTQPTGGAGPRLACGVISDR